MKNLLLIILLLIAIVMIFLGIKGGILPPTFTGVGFIIIALLFYRKK